MKHFIIAFFAMTFLATMHQKATAQDELKIVDYPLNPICKDTSKAPKDLLSFANAIQNNQVDFFQSGVSNMDWANKACEGFNYTAAERLEMENMTPGMLVKALKDTSICSIKYLNVRKDLLLNSGVDPNTGNIEFEKMKNDVVNEPYIVLKSPFNGQEAVIAKWKCRCNPQADLRKAKKEEPTASNDDVYFTPDENEGISESSSDANAKADANAEAKVIVEYVPVGATNYQQYSQPCGCYQPYQPAYQPYCYTPAYNSGLFFGVQILFTFQWGGQTYNAYDPNDQVVQNVVNNYNNTYVYNTTIINNTGGVSDTTTTTDTGGGISGTDGDPTDTGGGINGSGKQANPNHVVETLESNPITHNLSGLTESNQGSNLSSITGTSNSVHNVETLDPNPVVANVNGSDHTVATLSGNGNPTSNVNGVNHNVMNLDPNPVAVNTTNPNVFNVSHSQNGSVGYQQSGNSNVYTASNGTFNPQANYSQGVKTFSYSGQQLQTNQTQSQGQVLGYTATGTPIYANNTGVGNGYYNNNSDYNTVTTATTPNLLTTKGDVRNYATIPNQTLFNNSVNNQNTHLFSNNNNGIGTTSVPPRNLIFNQAPNFNLSQPGSRTIFQGGRGTF